MQPPIYQVLDARGNFKTLLTVIDRSGYKNTLSAAGYWTFFAPNDAAFQKYFTDNNLTLAAIDSTAARKIVTYCLVFNAFKTDHIADYQSQAGWVANNAYKRRTAYYDGFYTGDGPDGSSTVLLSANRNAGNNATNFVFGDNNNKYIPYFYSSFMQAKGLSATDYNFFYPNSTYTGFNVADGTVVNRDILAENGVIHEIDRVISALPSLEQQLAGNSQYSEFRKLVEQYMVTYTQNADATSRYNTLTGKSNKVYIKQYSNLLAYAFGNENYVKLQDNDGQTDGYSMFIPNNTVFTQYLNNTILEFYGAVNKLPGSIIADLINSHLFATSVWPTKFSTTNNFLGEPARFNVSNNIIEKKLCSNGLFYGTNQVQAANVFSTVYARAYLDPNYSLMTRILNNVKIAVTNPGIRYTLFMVPDATLRAMGYDYNTSTAQFTYTLNGTTTSGNGPRDNLQRLINLHIVPTPNNELNSLAGQGIIETYGNEYIKWNGNTVFAGGNVEKNQTIGVGGNRDYVNGRVYYLSSGSMEYPVNTLSSQIAKYANTTTAPYYDFYQYLISSTAYNPTNQEIAGLVAGASYTIFIPTRAAMQQAVRDGYLPGTVSGSTVTFTYNPSSADDKAKVARFIQYHILDGATIATDGKKASTQSGFPTFLTNLLGDKVEMLVYNQLNNMTVTDSFGRVARVVNGTTSNNLGTRTLFHQIDNYLRYNL
ncbi:fasciclin domain-containing protein [Mucilaginibacter daejeonensis]|uniref:fasciclin domain-containing protein n=1 Tax=Mucilaginibacter daejeonensis TaxID=398049 RepID=UPI001D173D51|nr:fasciclin domain-containing protein [Mucilaginibacter daejeonensis]UEG54994.1 fasciclin domain-containing protein [Mucilaginibacter daejeonensis]